jgi:hypothetical protein
MRSSKSAAGRGIVKAVMATIMGLQGCELLRRASRWQWSGLQGYWLDHGDHR